MSFLSVLILAAATTAAPADPHASAPLTAAEKAAASTIRASGLRADVRFLSHDLLEGRGPGSRGDQLAEAYIASRLEGLGLEPGAPDGSWFQPLELVSVTTHAPKVLRAQRGSESVEFALHDDYAVESGVQSPQAKVENAEVVFVGYGIVAPEYQWDDYKGVDLKGKVILMMNNDPEDDPKLFAGKTRLYYGRWDYKYEMAAKVGAAGAIIIHTTPSAGYPWQVVKTSFSGTRFTLPATGQPQVQATAWMTEDASKRLARLGGQDLDALRASAQKRDFKPVPLGVTISLALENDVKKTADRERDRPPERERPRARQAGRALHRASRSPGHQGGGEAGRGRDLQRRPRQRHGRRGPARDRPVHEDAHAGSSAHRLLRGGGRRRAGPAGLEVPGRPPAHSRGPHRRQHQHGRPRHHRPDPRDDHDRARQIEPRRRHSGPGRAARSRDQGRPVPRPRLLLPLRPVRARQGRRSRRLSRAAAST